MTSDEDGPGQQQQQQPAAAAASSAAPGESSPTPATRTPASGAAAAGGYCCPSNLRILICTGNLGNAAPTRESLAAWLPKNGSVDEVLRNARYPPPPPPEAEAGCRPPPDPVERDAGGSFDIVAVGMQEAVFTVRDKKGDATTGRQQLGVISEDVSERSGILPMTLSNLKLASLRGLIPRRDSEQSLSDDSLMSLCNEEAAPNAYDGGEAPNVGGGGEEGKKATTGVAHSSRDGPMSGKKSPKKVAASSSSGGAAILSPAKVAAKLTNAADGIASVAKEKLIAPIATGIISVAGDIDHNKGTAAGGGGGGGSNRHAMFGLSGAALQPKPGEGFGGTSYLYELGDEHMGDRYKSIVRYQRGEMRLAILVRKELVPIITHVETVAENTGIAGVVANKGGIVSTLTIGGTTRLSFLTAHLEAHEGEEHYRNRCSNLAEILSGAKKGNLDASITSHHMFVMGDLNFRVALPPPEGKEKWEGSDHRSKVRGMVEEEDWAGLYAADELRGALEAGDCLAGFKTLPCNFHPTFKVQRELGFSYQEKRTPSYTDRILWKSAHGLKEDVRPLLYEPVSDFATSDHKPVRGAYSVAIRGHESVQRPTGRDHRTLLSAAGSSKERHLHIFVSDMQCQDLSRVWEARQNAPYILFVTKPKELVRAKRSRGQIIADKLGIALNFSKSTSTRVRDGYLRTRVQMKDGTNPNWGEAEVHLTIKRVGIQGPEDLFGSFLYLNVYDKQGFSPHEDDYLIGTVALNLQELAKDNEDDEDDDDDGGAGAGGGRGGGRNLFKSIKGTGNSAPIFDMIDIDEPILKNGREKGRLTCTVMAWWLSPDMEGSNLVKPRSNRNLRGRKSKKLSLMKKKEKKRGVVF